MRKILYPGEQNFADTKVLTAYCLVEHSLLTDTKVKAFICLQDKPVHMHLNLGTASGSTQAFTIGKFIPDTLQIQADGFNVIPVSFDSAFGTVNISANADSNITADFDIPPTTYYQEMIVQFKTPNQTCFTFQTAAGHQLVSFKITATGKQGVVQQNFSAGYNILDHPAFPENISSTGSWRLNNPILLYTDDSVVDYSWSSVPAKINSVLCAFN